MAVAPLTVAVVLSTLNVTDFSVLAKLGKPISEFDKVARPVALAASAPSADALIVAVEMCIRDRHSDRKRYGKRA